MPRRSSWILLLLWSSLPAAEEPAVTELIPSQQPVLWMAQAYARCRLDDGVDAAEARTLASAYAAAYLGGERDINEVLRETADQTGERWACSTLADNGVTAGPTITVQVQTGAVQSAGRPTVQYRPGWHLMVIPPVTAPPPGQ